METISNTIATVLLGILVGILYLELEDRGFATIKRIAYSLLFAIIGDCIIMFLRSV